MKRYFRRSGSQHGYLLAASMMFILVGSLWVSAYLSMSEFEAILVENEIKDSQARLIAEMGLDFQQLILRLSDSGKDTDYEMTRKNPYTGRKETVGIVEIEYKRSSDGLNQLRATGYGVDERGRPWDEDFARVMQANVIKQTLAQYLWFTENEREPDNLYMVKFYWNDELDGMVRTNDVLHLNTRFSPEPRIPLFHKMVYSAADYVYFDPDPPGPQDLDEIFLGGLELEAPPIEYPHNAENIRDNAVRTFYGRWWNPEEELEERVSILIEFHENGTAGVYKRRFREPDNPHSYHTDYADLEDNIVDTLFNQLHVPQWPDEGSFFVHGVTEVRGRVRGNVSVGSSENLFIAGNIFYADSPEAGSMGFRGKPPEDSRNYLGLISEKRIIVANSAENRINSETWGVIINAAIAALGDGSNAEDRGCFTIQHMCSDDVDDARWSTAEPWMDEPPNPGDGWGNVLTFWGSMAQRYRGYVHRTECPSPNRHGGYHSKDYHFDSRFLVHSPPDYIEVDLETGGAEYLLYNWQERTNVNDD